MGGEGDGNPDGVVPVGEEYVAEEPRAGDELSGSPQIASSLTNGLRGLLVERGLWRAVLIAFRRRCERADEWLEETSRAEWVELDHYLAMMEAVREVAGEAMLLELGRERLRAAMKGGFLAPLMRSWMRGYRESFAHEPTYLVKVMPHAWNSSTRGSGKLEKHAVSEDEIVLAIESPPAGLRPDSAWLLFLKGFGLELLAIGELEGDLHIRSDQQAGAERLLFRFTISNRRRRDDDRPSDPPSGTVPTDDDGEGSTAVASAASGIDRLRAWLD